MDVNEKSCNGCTIINVKCCNENQCAKQFGKCKNKVLQGIQKDTDIDKDKDIDIVFNLVRPVS